MVTKLIFLVCFLSFSTAEKENDAIRLPDAIIPSFYVIKVLPFLDEGNFTVEGSVRIEFRTTKNTQKIVLHMKDIITKNESVKVSSSAEENFVIQEQSYDANTELYKLSLEKELKQNMTYSLFIPFIGILSSDLEGFYKTYYINNDQAKIWVAATQFQPTSARRAFPCFDEPQLKAEFEVHLGRKKGMKSLSNMPLHQTIAINEEYEYDVFQSTVPMSTYLLAFVVCDFEYTEIKHNKLNTVIKLWSQPKSIENLEFGKNVTIEGLIFLENFFNLSFPLPKLDLVALPEMSPNAMENWGLILFRESGLLHDLDKGSIEHKQWVAYLICHELAHQWFGNIVTMKWWTDLWLNEGFATYLGYIIVDHIFPSWNYIDTFVVNKMQTVMILDALKTAPSVQVTVEDPQRIRELFGDITYKKGASIIRMMNHFLGRQTFQKGLNLYLDKMKYASADQNDLWHFMDEVAHEDQTLDSCISMKNLMETWTSQTGFPVLNIWKRTNQTLIIDQKPFTWNEEKLDNRSWFIPVRIYGNSKIHWIQKGESKVEIPHVSSMSEWVIVNPNQIAYCRVNYDSRSWEQLLNQLECNHSLIPVISRTQLLDDSFNLAAAGLMEYNITLRLLLYLSNEKDPLPWITALRNLEYIDRMLRTTSLYGAFKSYFLSIIDLKYEEMGLQDNPSDSLLQKSLRTDLIKWACYLGHEGCIMKALNSTRHWMDHLEDESLLSQNVGATFLCVAVEKGDHKTWMALWHQFTTTKNSELKKSLQKALGCSTQVWVLQRYLEASFDPRKGIRRQDASKVYEIIGQNVIGSLLTWNHMKQNWILVRDYFGSMMFALPKVVKSITKHFNTIQHRDEMLWFQSKYENAFGSAHWGIKQAIEETQNNIQWMERNYDYLSSLLKTRGYNSQL